MLLPKLNVGHYKTRSIFGETRNFNKTMNGKPHAKTCR